MVENKRYKRVFLLVMDGVGVGAAPDAKDYGDEGSDTLGNVARSRKLSTPVLKSLGLYNIDGVDVGIKEENPKAAHLRLQELSAGKDTTTGHWEICGIVLPKPFPTYPNAFPRDFMGEFERRIGVKTIGNEVASGTEIIARLGEEHQRSGFPIVYTSADSVLQIAAHEETIPIDRLYEICRTAREMSDVGRIIARPFVGNPGEYMRTSNRRDFSLEPPEPNLLTKVMEAGLRSIGVGKIEDIFAFRGLTDSFHTHDNASSMEKVRQLAKEDFSGLVFANLIDFDMLYGHRNDVEGFAGALERLDKDLALLLPLLGDDDALILTADHGGDPTTPSTDHSREFVPMLLFADGIRPENHGTGMGFSVIASTAAKLLGLSWRADAKSLV
ncbi:MAG: phosphopentomutase [Christensenellales bacterium]|jgi:phosphopentomutase